MIERLRLFYWFRGRGGQQFEQMLGEGGSNKYGTTKVFATEKLSRQEIIDYAQSLAGAVPLEEKKIPKGMVYFAKKDGVTINLREYSSRDEKKLAGLLIQLATKALKPCKEKLRRELK